MTARPVDRGFKDIGELVAAVVAVALAAQVSVPVPGSPVPQSLQTLAVVLVGAWLGPRAGFLSIVLYVVVGALGVPVFAGGSGGLPHLTGPTLGYLLGFAAGAALMGWWVRQPWGRGLVGAFAGALVVHALILVFGWARLGAIVGPLSAFDTGVRPFAVGGFAKSVAAALLWLPVRAWVEREEDGA